MTTIAADLTSMSSDSMVSWGERSYFTKKTARCKGAIYGFAGDFEAVTKLLNWVNDGMPARKRPDINWEDVETLVLRKNGLFYLRPDFKEYPFNRACFAIGTGSMAAMGAMMAGAEPYDAVRIACDIDPNSSGEIHTEFLSLR